VNFSESRAISESEKPRIFASRMRFFTVSSLFDSLFLNSDFIFLAWSVILRISDKNQRSIFVISKISSTEKTPRNSASAMAKIRRGDAIRRFFSISDFDLNFFGESKTPSDPIASMRMAFWKTSGKFLPSAMTSPTDFISVAMWWETFRNFWRSHLGILRAM